MFHNVFWLCSKYVSKRVVEMRYKYHPIKRIYKDYKDTLNSLYFSIIISIYKISPDYHHTNDKQQARWGVDHAPKTKGDSYLILEDMDIMFGATLSIRKEELIKSYNLVYIWLYIVLFEIYWRQTDSSLMMIYGYIERSLAWAGLAGCYKKALFDWHWPGQPSRASGDWVCISHLSDRDLGRVHQHQHQPAHHLQHLSPSYHQQLSNYRREGLLSRLVNASHDLGANLGSRVLHSTLCLFLKTPYLRAF